MRLYLVRHGDAVPEDVDRARPLSLNGRGDIERMAGFVALQAHSITRVLHSGKVRAEQTAEILASKFAHSVPVQAVSGLDPLDDPAAWVRRIDTWTDEVMLVGHLPFMARLASCLLVGDAEAGLVTFEAGGIVCLKRVDQRWAIAWILHPALLPVSAGH